MDRGFPRATGAKGCVASILAPAGWRGTGGPGMLVQIRLTRPVTACARSR